MLLKGLGGFKVFVKWCLSPPSHLISLADIELKSVGRKRERKSKMTKIKKAREREKRKIVREK